MCGIVGYVGGERCVEVLMEGLRHLEYRGYDSAGLALAMPGFGGLESVKRVGPLENLARDLHQRAGNFLRVRVGIGHTRWATHGRPTEANAHPHLGGDGLVAVVHNGIIENHALLREELRSRGCVFRSETDTEVVAHLISERIQSGETLKEAFSAALKRIEGSFALAAMSAQEPVTIVAGRNQSPLVVGLGEGENFLASAVQALLSETRRFLVVENAELAVLTEEGVKLFTLDGEPVDRESFKVDWDAEAIELGDFEHYMLKEIHEQPGALGATLLGRVDTEGAVDLKEVSLDLSEINRVVIVACGTAYHAGLLGKQAIEKVARIPVEVSVASEYRYSDPLGDERTLLVAVSQSGETTDTLAAMEAARSFGGQIVAVTNTQGSLITREADTVLLTKAGPEIGVAATKTFLAQVIVLDLLALALARVRGTLSGEELHSLGHDLRLAPDKVEEALGLLTGRVEAAAALFGRAHCSLFLGRGISYPVALEGALKLKEISYIPAEGYPAGEMKHGPIALVNEHCPVVAVLGEGLVREKTLSNVEEIVARGAEVVSVARKDDPQVQKLSQVVLPMPAAPEILAPMLASVPLQLLAYHVAKDRGLNVDKPRNLAKSVTVE